jgi:hypothetical protein
MTLAEASQLAPIALMIIAGTAAGVGYWQLQTFKRFELLKILEKQQVRDARRLLFQKLRDQKEEPLWWQNDVELEKAASTVCASFDIVGLMATGCNRRFFRKHWAYPICWTYKALEKYIDARNPTGYHGFRKLYKEARDRP